MSCVFCDIAAHRKHAYYIYEDTQFVAFLDAFPKTWGHTQVIPKNHYRWVWDEPHVLQHFEVVNQIIQHYKQVLSIDTCYQTVWGNQIEHAHIHILPRFQPLHSPKPLSEDEAIVIQQRLQYKSC